MTICIKKYLLYPSFSLIDISKESGVFIFPGSLSPPPFIYGITVLLHRRDPKGFSGFP